MGVADPYKHASPHMCHRVECGRCRSDGMDVGRFNSKIHTAHARYHVTRRYGHKLITYLESQILEHFSG